MRNTSDERITSAVTIDSETSVVRALVCRRKGSDVDVLEAMTAEFDILGCRQIVHKGDQEMSTKALHQELAARRPEIS